MWIFEKYRLILIAAFVVFGLIAGIAAVSAGRPRSPRQAALDYQQCILQMRRVSSSQITSIMSRPDSLEQRTNLIAHMAVTSCNQERNELIGVLNKQGLVGQKYSDLITEIEAGSEMTLIAEVMESVVKKTEKR